MAGDPIQTFARRYVYIMMNKDDDSYLYDDKTLDAALAQLDVDNPATVAALQAACVAGMRKALPGTGPEDDASHNQYVPDIIRNYKNHKASAAKLNPAIRKGAYATVISGMFKGRSGVITQVHPGGQVVTLKTREDPYLYVDPATLEVSSAGNIPDSAASRTRPR
jgi:transcription antitermination factor NusG